MNEQTTRPWWTKAELEAALIAAGWNPSHQTNLFGEVVATLWTHNNGTIFNPDAVDDDGRIAWKMYASHQITPPPF